ncbi:MAG: UDP-N-acetylglucosamine 1-carboxyvinyltransferase [bacterium]|nr:UDP-N-acetylglucosamine 1-carboxyvinyltransferase [bacterium]
MEDAYVIKGGVPLNGEIQLSGAKNVALKVIISSLLFDNEVVLQNIPRINDVFELLHLIKLLGGKAEFTGQNTVTVDGRSINTDKVDLLHGSKIRVSFMLFAPLLHKFGTCQIPNPGGCRIGARPIDRIVEGMKKLGIQIDYDTETGYYKAKMNQKPEGKYSFNKPSHTGTELMILISVFGKNSIELINSALEPEVDELIRFLNDSGAQIKRNGSKIIIYGVTVLHQKNPFSIISDRNEAITYATLAIATKGSITISSIPYSLIETFVKILQKAGGGFNKISNTTFNFYYKEDLRAVDIETAPHPGFMTDWQPNWAILMTQAKGNSIIHERVFENRFSYVDELRKLGMEIEYVKVPVTDPFEYFFFNFDPSKKYNQAIRITGSQQIHSGVLTILDLRAGATLAIAALISDGESVVNGASILDRGYEDFIGKITKLGGNIKKL